MDVRMRKKLVEVGTSVLALIVLAAFSLVGAALAGSQAAPYLYLVGILAFTIVLIVLGMKVSEPVM